MGGRSEGHMHTTVKRGEPGRQCGCRPPHTASNVPTRAESFPLEDTDAGRCPVRRQFGRTSTMEWEGTAGGLLSVARGQFACYRPAEGLGGPPPACRRAAASSTLASSHAHPYALYDLEDSWERKENRRLRYQTAERWRPSPPSTPLLLTLPLAGWLRAD